MQYGLVRGVITSLRLLYIHDTIHHVPEKTATLFFGHNFSK